MNRRTLLSRLLGVLLAGMSHVPFAGVQQQAKGLGRREYEDAIIILNGTPEVIIGEKPPGAKEAYRSAMEAWKNSGNWNLP